MSAVQTFLSMCVANRLWDLSAVKRYLTPQEFALYSKTISTPAKWKIIEQGLYHKTCIEMDRVEFMRTHYTSKTEEAEAWKTFFRSQGYESEKIKGIILKWLTSKYGRKNVLRIVGGIGTGKSMFAKALAEVGHDVITSNFQNGALGDSDT